MEIHLFLLPVPLLACSLAPLRPSSSWTLYEITPSSAFVLVADSQYWMPPSPLGLGLGMRTKFSESSHLLLLLVLQHSRGGGPVARPGPGQLHSPSWLRTKLWKLVPSLPQAQEASWGWGRAVLVQETLLGPQPPLFSLNPLMPSSSAPANMLDISSLELGKVPGGTYQTFV
jgi:hypothetical protein